VKQLSFLALLAVVVVTAPAANVQAQTKPDPASIRLYSAMRAYILDKAVIDELKLDETQQAKLTALQKETRSYLTDVSTLTYLLPEKDSTELRNQSQLVLAQEMLTILKDNQTQRLKEITLQQAASGQGFYGSILTLNPKVADELKLTDEQKTKLRQGGRRGQSLMDLLTDEQKKKWSDIAGKPFEGKLGPGGRPGGNFLTFTLAVPLQYLDDPAVQKDLELTDAQKKKLAELDKKQSDVVAKLASLNDEEQSKLADETRKQLTKDVEELLSAAQVKRLKQLRFQFTVAPRRFGGGGPGGGAFDGVVIPMQPIYVLPTPTAANSLHLNEEQTTQIRKRAEQRETDVGKALLSDDKFEDIEKKVAKLNESANADLLALLTDEQKTEFKELTGKAFNGPIPPPFGFRGGPGLPRGFIRIAVVEDLYFAELLYLTVKDVQAELKLTEDQIKQVSTQEEKWRTALMYVATTLNAEKRAKALKSLSALVEKQMGDLLKAEQMKRLKQLAIRARADVDGTTGLCSYPGAAAELKLTADQKAKAAAGEPEKAVLSEEQRKKVRELRGEPIGFSLTTGGFGGPGRFFSPAPERLNWLEIESIQKEVKLTEAQLTKVRVIGKKHQTQVRIEEEKADGQYPAEKIQALDEATLKALDALLMPEQSKRLRQLELQQVSQFNLGEALREKDVIEGLKLSKDQQEKIAAIEEDNKKRVTLLDREIVRRFGRGGPGGGPGTGPMTPDVRGKLNERRQTKLQEVLTTEQKEKWKELLGKPFDFGGPPGFPE